MHDPIDFADPHLTELGLALDFGPDDLAANQQGRLSLPQAALLDHDLRWFYGPMIGGLVILAFLIGLSSALNGELALFPVILLMALAMLPAYLLRQELSLLADRRVERTMLKLGSLGLVARRWGLVDTRGPFGGVNFPVMNDKPVFGPRHLYRMLNARRTYVVYYAPVRTWRGFRLLSIEPVTSPPPGTKPKRKAKRG